MGSVTKNGGRAADTGLYMETLSQEETVDLSFHHLTYSVPVSVLSRKRKEILKGVSGELRAGELSAIMGPSGAGKTTLLNVLSGFVKEGVSGTICCNGRAWDAEGPRTRSVSAYIMHQDNLNPLFTVLETMAHAAHMKLGRSYSQHRKLLLIDKILTSMSMSHTKKTRCDRLSGGERKRLNVCLELVDNPPVLFLDEPTSGLDSSNCRLLVRELKELAERRRTVVCTIHQPSASIFSLFDHLYLVDGGQNVYQGDASSLLPFLDHVGLPCPIFHNPADFVMDVVTGEFGDHRDILIATSKLDKWRDGVPALLERKASRQHAKSDKKVTEKRNSRSKAPSEWIRYTYLVEKLYRQQNRDLVMTYCKLALHIMSALSIGVMFYRFGDDATKVFSNTIYLFLTTVYICYTTVMPATVKFPCQLMVMKREHFNNWYKFRTYFLAFLTVNVPLQLLFSGIFLVISYSMTNQPLEWYRFWLFALSTALETIISDMFGLMMGTVGISVNGIFIGNVYLIMTTLLGGYFAPIKNLVGFLQFLSYFSFIRYSFELKLTAIYGMGRPKLICPNSEFYCHITQPKEVFQWIGLEDGQVTRDMSVLIVFTVVMTVLAFFRVRYCLKKFQNKS